MTTRKSSALVPVERIAQSILILRGQRVVLDSDLAALYDHQAIQRAGQAQHCSLPGRFYVPAHRRRTRRYAPYAFTEHGAIMAAMILNSPRAVEMSAYVVRAFVQLRDMLTSNKEVAQKLAELEHKLATHDQAITGIIKTLRDLMNPPEAKKRPIGFVELQEKK